MLTIQERPPVPQTANTTSGKMPSQNDMMTAAAGVHQSVELPPINSKSEAQSVLAEHQAVLEEQRRQGTKSNVSMEQSPSRNIKTHTSAKQSKKKNQMVNRSAHLGTIQ